MAKAKKSAGSGTKSTGQATWPRTLAIHGAIACMFGGSLAAGFYYVQDYVQREVAAPKEPPAVVIKNRPRWMSDFLVEHIAETARPPGVHSPFDHESLMQARQALEQNPWIAKVHDVRRAYGRGPGDLLEINCEYRVPVALVRWGDYYSLVDREGYKLPEQYEARDVPRIVRVEEGRVDIRIIEGVRKPPPEPGRKWPGDDLAAALEMAGVLFDKAYAQEILKINVGHFYSKGDAQVVLVTRYNTEIRWGRVPSAKDAFVEVDAAQKLERMRAVFAQYGRVDASQPGGLDIRFDSVTYPGASTAGASLDARH